VTVQANGHEAYPDRAGRCFRQTRISG